MPLLVVALSLFCSVSQAGYFVEKSMHSPNHIVVGRGETIAQAHKDAVSAIPKGQFKADPDNSPVSQCIGDQKPDSKLESCGTAAWQIVVPLIKI